MIDVSRFTKILGIQGMDVYYGGEVSKIPAIYMFVIGDSFYIGSSNNIGYRFLNHAQGMTTYNHSNNKVNRAYQIHQKCDFYIVEEIQVRGDLKKREQYYIDLLKPDLNIGTPVSKKINTSTWGTIKKGRTKTIVFDSDTDIKIATIKIKYGIDARDFILSATKYFTNEFYDEKDGLDEDALDIINTVMRTI